MANSTPSTTSVSGQYKLHLGKKMIVAILPFIGLCFSETVNAQFAYKCFPDKGSPYVTAVPCPVGVIWQKTLIDQYYHPHQGKVRKTERSKIAAK